MLELTDDAVRLLRTQHGIVSVPQQLAIGHNRTAIDKLQRHGWIDEVLQGAYRLRGTAPTFESSCAVVCIAHPSVAIADPSAGRLWGLRRLPGEVRVAESGALHPQVHVIAPSASQPTVKPWGKAYRTASIHHDDAIERSDGIRVTTRPRTALISLDSSTPSIFSRSSSRS